MKEPIALITNIDGSKEWLTQRELFERGIEVRYSEKPWLLPLVTLGTKQIKSVELINKAQ